MPSEMDIPLKSFDEIFTLGEKLGRGAFADVHVCCRRLTEEEFAVKIVRNRQFKTGKKEATILSQLQHEHVIALHEALEWNKKIYLVMDLIRGCDLSDHLAKQTLLTEEETTNLLRQLLLALSYVHSKHILHLDIKPGNILVEDPGSGRAHVKLIDFGLAQQLDASSDYKAIMGTDLFMAPEVVNYDTLGSYTDMWAVGVMTYMMLSGLNPFEGATSQEVFVCVMRGQYSLEEPEFNSITEAAKSFIRGLLEMEPQSRLTAEQCLSHAWMEPPTPVEQFRRRSSSVKPMNLAVLKGRGALGTRCCLELPPNAFLSALPIDPVFCNVPRWSRLSLPTAPSSFAPLFSHWNCMRRVNQAEEGEELTEVEESSVGNEVSAKSSLECRTLRHDSENPSSGVLNMTI